MDTGKSAENKQNNQTVKGIKQYIPFVLELAKIIVIALVIVWPIRHFIFKPFIVEGASMVPSFQSGNYLIVDELSYRFKAPQRGDVVVFNAGFIKGYAGQRFIKRVIGLPGETVNVKNGKVEITKDGKTVMLDEKYLPDDLATMGEVNKTLKSDEYFVMGDNREYSYDSRMWGILPKADIVGKAFVRVYPFNEITTFSALTY